jgi:hypothetical protein
MPTAPTRLISRLRERQRRPELAREPGTRSGHASDARPTRYRDRRCGSARASGMSGPADCAHLLEGAARETDVVRGLWHA